MPPDLLDTHCHLDQPPLRDGVAAVLQRAVQAGVRRCVTVGTTVESSRRAVELARSHPGVRAAVGIHPHEADTATEEMVQEIARLAEDPQVAAIGEVGLDFFRQHAAPENQHRVFEAFRELAQRRRLPLAIHCRHAYAELLALLARASAPIRGVLHCASGPPDFIEAALGLGLHVSFAGNVTFPNADALRQLVPLVPDDRLLLETDAPFLAPQPMRGKPNEPAFLAETALVVARLRGISVDALGEMTSRNACRVFGFAEDPPRHPRVERSCAPT